MALNLCAVYGFSFLLCFFFINIKLSHYGLQTCYCPHTVGMRVFSALKYCENKSKKIKNTLLPASVFTVHGSSSSKWTSPPRPSPGKNAWARTSPNAQCKTVVTCHVSQLWFSNTFSTIITITAATTTNNNNNNNHNNNNNNMTVYKVPYAVRGLTNLKHG